MFQTCSYQGIAAFVLVVGYTSAGSSSFIASITIEIKRYLSIVNGVDDSVGQVFEDSVGC